ncbi:MAG: polysaccharide biosynthesis C-terminal domain-containing protein, partial [Clostridia bacterium]|nr:polysaccharide biosynthesis C-terminal domain-containing protein [Clostridia bacterium]
WGLPFVFFYNIATGVFSALGDSKTPFFFLAASSTANVAVDILFVTAFNMGVAGVAWATFLCQGISCLLAVSVVFLRLRKIHTDVRISGFSVPIGRCFRRNSLRRLPQRPMSPASGGRAMLGKK